MIVVGSGTFDHALIVLQCFLQSLDLSLLYRLPHTLLAPALGLVELAVEFHLDVFLARHCRRQTLRLLPLGHRFRRTILGIVALLLAEETRLVFYCLQVELI